MVKNAIADLELHGKIFDMMGLSKTPYNNINIHCNGVYGDKQSAMDRLITNFKRLSPSVRKRLTLENDDNWRETHKLASKIWVPGGVIVTVATLVLPETIAFICFITIIIIISIIPMGYSYLYFKKHQQ